DYYPGNYNGFINGQQVIGYNLVVYTPPADYTGIDKFEFQYCVDNNCQLVKIDMEVEAMPNSSVDTFCVAECVWSGDANNDGTVDIQDLLPIGYCVGEVGRDRPNGSTEWFGQYSSNWNGRISQTQVNLKYVDTNGDGFITAADTTALSQHYGFTHNLTPSPDPVSSNLPLFFVPQSPGPYNPGDLVLVDIVLGNQAQPALDMSGLTFIMNYNNAIVEPGTFEVNFDGDNWMAYNSPMLNMSKYPFEGRVEVGYTRTSGVTASGFGKIGSLNFIVVDDLIDGLKVVDTIQTQINVPSPAIMNSLGIYEGLAPYYLDIPITLPGKDPFGIREDDLLVFPNPTEDILNVHVNGKNEIREIYIYTLTGQRMFASGRLYTKNTQIDMSHFGPGMYLVNAITDKGVITKKVEVMKY
ncbi:MAG: T9SS type A sorting domain-containing protein, partial [Bacteroidota bacterium]